MRPLRLVNQLWVIVPVNPWKNHEESLEEFEKKIAKNRAKNSLTTRLRLVVYIITNSSRVLPPSRLVYLRIGSCLAYVYRVMDARGKFGEHE